MASVQAKKPVPMQAPGAVPTTPDPFASIGGGVQVGGNWVPKGHPLASQAEVQVQAPPLQPASGPAQPATSSPDPFASMGGGVHLPTGEWVPQGHPAAGQPAPAPASPVSPTPATPAAGPAAQPAPGAAPAPANPTTAYKDALMKMLADSQQAPSLNDPALKAQSDAFAVGQQRGAERDRMAAAEAMSLDGTAGINSGAFDSDVSGIKERAGERQSAFNAGLVGDASKQQLQKLTTALSMMGSDMNSAEGRALQERIAQLQAQIQREGQANQMKLGQGSLDNQRYGIDAQTALGGRDLSLRDKLGSGGLNLGLLQALIGNQNFNNNLGANLGMFNANLNQNALLQMLGGL